MFINCGFYVGGKWIVSVIEIGCLRYRAPCAIYRVELCASD